MPNTSAPSTPPRGLAIRLTLGYGGVLFFSLSLTLVLIYGMMLRTMRSHDDERLTNLGKKSLLTYQQGGILELVNDLNKNAVVIGTENVFFVLRDAEGKTKASSDLLGWSEAVTQCNKATPKFEYRTDSKSLKRVRVGHFDLGDGLHLCFGIYNEKDADVIFKTELLLMLFSGLGLVVALLIGRLLAKRALSGMEKVEMAAARISQGGALDMRVPISKRDDEVDRLAKTFNAMLDRVQNTVRSMRETNDNIAHELRSPVTRIRGLAELSLTHEASLLEYQDLAVSAIEDCDHLLYIINTMLNIAQMEAGADKPERIRVDLAQIVHSAVEFFTPVAQHRNIGLVVESTDTCFVSGNTPSLQRILANLLDNAIKYSLENTLVKITLTSDRNKAQLSIANCCPSLKPEELPHLFERFYRGQHARTQNGNGLGLALVNALVCSLEGEIKVSMDGEWVTFNLILPVV